MKQSKIVTIAQLLFVWILLQTSLVEASIPEPDNVLYGTATLDGQQLSTSNTNMAVILAYDNLEVGRYTFGDDQQLQDRYLLNVRVDALSETSFQYGDIVQVQFKLDDEIYTVGEMTVAGRGNTTELNLVMTRAQLIASKESEESDSDGDGIPDQVEIANGLNPFDASDAALDADGDTLTNLEEFINGSDILRDEQAPQIIASTLTTLSATGLFTQALDIGAVAFDDKDGLLETTTAENGFYKPGRYEVLWTATDAAGNEASDTQTLVVNPIVNFYSNQQVAVGTRASVSVELNGIAANYPVTIPFTVSGSAQANGVDYTLIASEFVINSGLKGSIEFDLIDDGDATETTESIILTLGTPTNAVIGQRKVFVASVMQNNIAPKVQLSIEQADMQSSIVVKGQGFINVTAIVSDPDAADQHSFDWALTDSALSDSDGDAFDSVFTIDSDAVEAGIYTISLRVIDTAGNIAYSDRLIEILEEVPVLTNDDSDGDGVADNIDGFADVDGDGIAQYLDAVDQSYVLPAKTAQSNSFLVETHVGLRLSLGKAARQLQVSRALISISEIASVYTNLDAGSVSFINGLENFTARGLALSDSSISIVIPQLTALPTDPVYTTLSLGDLSWNSFVQDDANAVYSAPGAEGYCPAPQDQTYIEGLKPGNWCVMLRIQDGGANDADGKVNGAVSHLGGVEGYNPIGDSDLDGFANEVDAFPNDPTEWLDSDGDGIGNNADLDDDNDGVSDRRDAYPLIAIGDFTDTDNDGAPNMCNQSCLSLGMAADSDDDNDGILDISDAFPLIAAADTIAPVFEETLIIELAATSKITDIASSINIIALDAIDGEIMAEIVGDTLFESGAYQIQVSATDRAGNQSIGLVALSINPLTQLGMDKLGEPGATVYLQIELSGKVAAYPVSLEYGLTGSDIASGSISIDSGSTLNIPIVVPDNTIEGDIIRFTLNNAENAALGEKLSANIYVQQSNLAPVLEITIEQGDKQVAVVDASAGDVTISAVITDINRQDQHTVEWAESELGMFTGQRITLDASQLSAGTHQIVAIATETNSDELLSTKSSLSFVVAAELPTLNSSDTDGDGISDSEEGYADGDGDGIPDFEDNNADTTQLPMGDELIIAETGIVLSVGSVAQSLSQGLPVGAIIDAQLLSDTFGSDMASDSGFYAITDIINFKASGLANVGSSMSVVVTLPNDSSLPTDAVYRKFFTDSGWVTFVADSQNRIASADKINGACPAPGSAVYQAGLNEADKCIALTLLDGGFYDLDGEANGSIEDPGVFAVVNQMPTVTLSSVASANEGTRITITADAVDPEGQALTYVFEQVSSGNTATITSDNGVATVVLPDVAQTSSIVFKVTVTDSSGGTASAETTISVLNVPIMTPPTDTVDKGKSGGSGTLLNLMFLIGLIICRNVLGGPLKGLRQAKPLKK